MEIPSHLGYRDRKGGKMTTFNHGLVMVLLGLAAFWWVVIYVICKIV